MTLWGVTMVKDELDVLPYTLAHMIGEGVDGLIIADNLSTDGTWEWLCTHVPDLPCETILERDEEVAYYQSVKMTGHYQHATRLGADWVIPFDADEVWHSSDGRSLATFFAELGPDVDCAEAAIYNYFPTSGDDPAKEIPFQRILHRDPMVSVMVKTAVRAAVPGLVVEQGNHGAHAERPLRAARGSLTVGHFPWRSPDQFERKVANGSRAYDATGATMGSAQGAHWRQHGQILHDSGSAALRQVYDEWFLDPPIDLQRCPVPWRG